MQESSSAPVSMTGVAGLLRSGDAATLVNLPAILARGVAGAGPSLAQAVCEYFNGNVAGLRVLAELVGRKQPVPRLRQCAAFALRNVHSRESLPYLASLLDSEDGEVRYEGVAGLAPYANSGFVPGERPLTVDGVVQARHATQARTAATEANFPALETFRQDERSVIEFWREWARAYAATP